MSIRKISVLSIFIACAFAVNYLESFVHLPIPSIRLGLANLFSLTALMLFGIREALVVAFARLALSYLLTGNALALSCSFVGILCSLTIEYIFFACLKITYPVILSLAGALCFNLGQLVVVYLLLTNIRVFFLAPIILAIGILTGIIVGLLVDNLLRICRRL